MEDHSDCGMYRPGGSGRALRLVLAIAFGAAVGLLLYYGYGDRTRKALGRGKPAQYAGRSIYTETGSRSWATVASVDEDVTCSRQNALVRAVESVEPCVVSLSVTHLRVYSYGSPDPFWEPFLPRREIVKKIPSMGSGFIVSRDGYILTNEHVVRNASEIMVNLPDGRQFKAKDVISDRDTDLALVKVDAEDLPFATLGDSDRATIGEWAIAIGNPFGMIMSDAQPTVTVGVVSALSRDFGPIRGDTVYQDMIQTDAAINPGNSGGPLVNCLGEVIGINTFIVSQIEGSIGLGFAMPINRAKRIMDEMIRHGKVRRFWTGLWVENIDTLVAQKLGLENTQGVIVVKVSSDSPAERSGFRVGDVVRATNGEPIANEEQIRNAFVDGTVGTTYSFSVVRHGQPIELSLRLDEAVE